MNQTDVRLYLEACALNKVLNEDMLKAVHCPNNNDTYFFSFLSLSMNILHTIFCRILSYYLKVI